VQISSTSQGWLGQLGIGTHNKAIHPTAKVATAPFASGDGGRSAEIIISEPQKMTLDQDTIKLMTNGILICLGLYLAFFKSYFTEKGKQLAVKEDVEEITEKVEKIKSEFINETEEIKAELEFLTQNKFSLANEERSSILDYFANYSHWLNTILSTRPASIFDTDKGLTERRIELIRDAKLSYDISESRAELFFNDPKFIELKSDLVQETLKLQQNGEVCLEKVRNVHTKIDDMVKVTPNEQHSEKISELLESKETIIDEFCVNQVELHKGVLPIRQQMVSYLRKKLFSIINENKFPGKQ